MAQRPDNIDQEDWDSVQGELARIGGAGGGIPLNTLINAKPEDLGNDANLEALWAEKAFKHAETYFGILQIMADKTKLKLTQIDEHIYQNFRIHFPAASFPVSSLTEDILKNPSAKLAWRTFCNEYEKNASIVDFNMGTLMRLDATKGYDPDNTTIVPRIQFFAIEIARNREGANASIKKNKQ